MNRDLEFLERQLPSDRDIENMFRIKDVDSTKDVQRDMFLKEGVKFAVKWIRNNMKKAALAEIN